MPDIVRQSTEKLVRTVRAAVGVWQRVTHTFIRFEGTDVATWLQTQTSNDVLALQSGEGHANTILDRKGRLQAHFTLHRWEDEYWLIIERQQAARLLEHLDAHLFLEDVRMGDASDEVEQLLVQGPRSAFFLATLMESFETAAASLPSKKYGCHPIELLGHQVLAFLISDAGEDGFVLVTQAGEARPLLDKLLNSGNPIDVA